ncbi:hypothetical protein GCM10010343_43720 [Streptomyces avidinii]|nr:hypothetical protein GCM10010343_43720 [Streptomyces avidinii]
MMPRISGTRGSAQASDITNATMARALVFCGCGAYQPGCGPPTYGPGWPGCPGCPGYPYPPGCEYGPGEDGGCGGMDMLVELLAQRVGRDNSRAARGRSASGVVPDAFRGRRLPCPDALPADVVVRPHATWRVRHPSGVRAAAAVARRCPERSVHMV